MASLIDWNKFAIPKGPTTGVLKARRDAERDRIDDIESKKVKARSNGRCEIAELNADVPVRCKRSPAPGNHHMKGGSGRRNVGESILATWRQAACATCHADITAGRLKLVSFNKKSPATTAVYKRVR